MPSGLLGTRYAGLARNTIDYWMLPDAPSLSRRRVMSAFEQAPVFGESTLRLYLHVPYCAQRCRFCAFSGGNSLAWKDAQRYATLLVRQLRDQWGRSPMRGRPIRSVNIGGGSPDLLGDAIELVLDAVRSLPGFNPSSTELSVEFALSTVRQSFVDTLVKHAVTKVSFGVQSLDPVVRQYMRQPKSLASLERVLEWIDGRIPVVNADLITGLPGQDRSRVVADLQSLIADPRISAISSYLLTTGAAPTLIAAVEGGVIPSPPDSLEQALMRLETYGAFRRAGWIRRGTNTYVDPRRVPPQVRDRLAGDECLGAAQYENAPARHRPAGGRKRARGPPGELRRYRSLVRGRGARPHAVVACEVLDHAPAGHGAVELSASMGGAAAAAYGEHARGTSAQRSSARDLRRARSRRLGG